MVAGVVITLQVGAWWQCVPVVVGRVVGSRLLTAFLAEAGVRGDLFARGDKLR
jgi:hypothetical protein